MGVCRRPPLTFPLSSCYLPLIDRVFPFLPPGEHSQTTELAGFATHRRGIELRAGANLAVDIFVKISADPRDDYRHVRDIDARDFETK